MKTHLILDKIGNMNSDLKSKLVNFVNKIEKRRGYCTEVELFEIVDLWLLVFDEMIRYENLTVTKQIERMWRDLKMIYINIEWVQSPEKINELKRNISNVKDKELIEMALKICELISTGKWTLNESCILVGATEKTFQSIRTRYQFLNEEYKKSKKLKSLNIKKMKKLKVR